MSSTAGSEDKPTRRARGEDANRVDANRIDGSRYDAGTDYDDDTRAYAVSPVAEPALVSDPNAATRETVVARE
jgi:hypothetical protein